MACATIHAMKAVAPSSDSVIAREPVVDYPDFYNPVRQDLEATRRLILTQIESCEPLIGQIGHYVFNNQGKHIRPLLTLLTAKQCQYQGQSHINLAAAIECLHTATLLHDDVIDESHLRRQQPATHLLWGNTASILLGDYLHARAFQLLVSTAQLEALSVFSKATSVIVEGEIMQLAAIGDVDLDEKKYREIIGRKTATLFQACTQSAAVLAKAPENERAALQNFGWHFGLAYQMLNDMLDYSDTTSQAGKDLGDDLAEGKMTLPIIHALERGNPRQKEGIRRALACRAKTHFDEVLAILQETESLTYVRQVIAAECEHMQLCLAELSKSPYQQALAKMAARFCTSNLPS